MSAERMAHVLALAIGMVEFAVTVLVIIAAPVAAVLAVMSR